MTAQLVTVSRAGNVALLQLNRPERRNALSVDLLAELAAHLDRADTDDTVRGIVITGAGTTFSAGADIDEATAAVDVPSILRYLQRLQRIGQQIETLAKPVVAAINGACLTGGLELAMSCDWRVASARAIFGVTSARIGSFPGMGASIRLPRLVGAAKAKTLIMSGQRIDAPEAAGLNLIDEIATDDELMPSALAWLHEITQSAPSSIWLTKLAFAADQPSLHTETLLATIAFATRDRMEGMTAFRERRAAHFTGQRAVEFGATVRGALTARLLAQLGADTTVVRHRKTVVPNSNNDDTATRTVELLQSALDTGKTILEIDAGGEDLLEIMIGKAAGADIVVMSDDVDLPAEKLGRVLAEGATVCRITALGEGNQPGSELTAQALAGVLATTGVADQTPTRVGPPIGDYVAAVNAVTSVLAQRLQAPNYRPGKALEVNDLDSLTALMTPFFTKNFAGLDVTRMGNRHPSTSPWNTYPTADGTVVLCTITNAQWAALAAAIGDPTLTTDPAFATVSSRHDAVERVDQIVAAWTQSLTTDQVIAVCAERGIPAGNVATTEQVMAVNGVQAATNRPNSGCTAPVMPLSPFPWIGFGPVADATTATSEPVITPASAAPAQQLTQSPDTSADGPARPLAGVRIVEIGSFTAGPVCARLLAGLGADVIKVETPGGDTGRAWSPVVDGQSYFFLLNNTDKRSIVLDLKDADGAQTFADLLSTADVLVSNLAPGALDRLGFTPTRLHDINPQLVTLLIAGFMPGSPLQSRRALDTVVQAESGIMAATGQPDGAPVKAGVSLADSVSAMVGAMTVTAALLERSRTGHGSNTTLAMYQIMVWLTELNWASKHISDLPAQRCGNRSMLYPAQNVYAATDGLLAVGPETGEQLEALARITAAGHASDSSALSPDRVARWVQALRVDESVAQLNAAGVPAAPVLESRDAAASELLRIHEMVTTAEVAHSTQPGTYQTALGLPLATGSPMRLRPRSFIGSAGSANDDILTELKNRPPQVVQQPKLGA